LKTLVWQNTQTKTFPGKEQTKMLPTQKTKITKDLNRQNILIYGLPKAGKSSLAAEFPNTLFVATEDGHKHLEVFKVDAPNWPQFIQTCGELKQGGHNFKTIVIDIADWLYKHCEDYICQKHGVEAPADLPYGKGFSLVKAEFVRTMNKINMMGISIVFISHAKEKEIKSKNSSFTMMGTSMTGSAEQVIAGMCDLIFYCYINEENKRLIRTKPTKYVLAGDRTKPGLPELIPMNFKVIQDYLK
jgi:hypothetical protein